MRRKADYDRLIVTNKEIVAGALRGAGVIGENSAILYLGKILNIDALFAEVDNESTTFRRFVIAEDKLFRNQEAHRDVLGQVLDYAKELHKTGIARLSELLPDRRAWLDANEDLVAQALRDSDFLLLVCGDQIRPRLVDYVSHLKKQLDPLVGADIALLCMAIFSNGTCHILIPHVVAIVTSERDLTVRVVVQSPSGGHLPASVEIDEGTGPIGGRRVKIELDALLKKIGEAGGKNAVEIAQALFAGAGEFGADVIPCAASASVRVKDPNSGNRSTLFVVTKKATFYVYWLDRWAENANVSPDVAETYEGNLAKILGRSPRGEPGVPLADMGEHIDQVRGAIRMAVSALRHTEQVPTIFLGE